MGQSIDPQEKVHNRPEKEIADAAIPSSSDNNSTNQDELGDTAPFVIYEFE